MRAQNKLLALRIVSIFAAGYDADFFVRALQPPPGIMTLLSYFIPATPATALPRAYDKASAKDGTYCA